MDVYWQKVEDALEQASEMPPSEYQVWLAEFCAGDEKLKAEIESFLSLDSKAENFLEKSVGNYIADVLNEDEINLSGKTFGNYRIIREIGHGGMGAVFLAERTDGQFQQEVAIKIVRQTIAESELINRFKRERQILASLNHPNIAKLLDGGVSETGEPFLAMEFVDGEAITKFVERGNLNLEDRLKLFLKVCSAVQYAHRNLIVHRDLKPSNIFVTAENEPKLLDFGLAKLLDENILNDETETQTAFRALTPAYASPEQLKNEPITTASDIYSLGIVLYELLTGERPFNFEGKSLDQIIKTLTEFEPLPPSANSKSKVQNPQLHGDLDNIVLMALRKEPERRYQSVEQLSTDIESYLKGLPVSARPNTFRYRAEKFIKRNKVSVIACLLVLIALVVGLISTAWQARVAAHERDNAQQEQAKAEQLNTFLQSILSSASPEEKGKDAKVLDVLNDAVQKMDTEFANQPELKARALLTIGQTYIQLGLVDEPEKILRKALKLNSELYGEENKATAACMTYLGAALITRGSFDETEQLFKRAIEIDRKMSPAGNKEFALTLDGLGELYVRKGDCEKAKPLLQESAAMSDKLNGENNADSAFTLISLARAQACLADYAGAEATARQSISIYRQLPARYEMRLATALLNLGILLVKKGNFDEAISIMREAENIFSQKQGDGYTSFEAKIYLCNAYFSKYDFAQSIVEGNKAIDMGRKLKLESAPDFLLTLETVGISLTRSGKASEGEAYLTEAVKISPDSTSVSGYIAKSLLGECLMMQKKYDEARPLLQESYENLKTSLGENNPQTVANHNWLVKLDEQKNQK